MLVAAARALTWTLLTASAVVGAWWWAMDLLPREETGGYTVLALAVLTPPLALGVATQSWATVLWPLAGYLLAVATVVALFIYTSESYLAPTPHDLWPFVVKLVLPYWIPVGWGGIVISFLIGRGLRLARARQSGNRGRL